MASVSASRRWFRCFLIACLCCCLVPACRSGGAALNGEKRSTADIVGRAFICLNDRYIYSGCQRSYRLDPEGTLDVPPVAADAFCGGPCLEETNLVLKCIDDVMDNFRFYNGPSVDDVRFALDRGCSRTGLRGDFDVLQRLGGDGHYGDNFFYGRGSGGRSVSRSLTLLLLLSAERCCNALLGLTVNRIIN